MQSSTQDQPSNKIHAFTFGEVQEISSYFELSHYFESQYNGEFYELPYSINAHAKYFYSLVYLRSALQLKANVLASCFLPTPYLSRKEFAKFAIDYLWFGNAYAEKITSRTGKILALKTSPAKFTRRGLDDVYKFITAPHLYTGQAIHTFTKGSVYHLIQPDINQELYGVPEWLPAVQSAQLNESATKFRLRYYNNGSHAGYILYLTDPQLDEKDVDELTESLKNSKGPGNFRNLMLYSPNGQKDGLQLIPISEVTAKDEFFNIKAVSRDDQLAACRVPPNVMGIVPTNTSGFGDVSSAAEVFARNEILPLQNCFLELNDWLGVEAVKFVPYTIKADSSTTDDPTTKPKPAI